MKLIKAKWLHGTHLKLAVQSRTSTIPAQTGIVEWIVINAERKAKQARTLEEKIATATASLIADMTDHQPWSREATTELIIIASRTTSLMNGLDIDQNGKMALDFQKAYRKGALSEQEIAERIHSAIRFSEAMEQTISEKGRYTRG